MADKRILANLARYSREMKNEATSHDKFILLLSGGILIGCGVGTFRDPAATMGWPVALTVGVGLAVGAVIWFLGFSLGVWCRGSEWRQAFPPYQLIGAATIPVLIIAMGVGLGFGTAFFGLPVSSASLAALAGYLAVVVVMHLLFIVHTPMTRTAVRLTHNPNVMTVDSHRHMWLFPALGVLILFYVGPWVAPADLELPIAAAVTSALTAAAAFAGFGSGYIP